MQQSKTSSEMTEEIMQAEKFPSQDLPQLKQNLVETDSTEILNHLKNYSNLDSDQRLKIARTISVMYEQLSPELRDFTQLKAVLNQIVKDKENIAKALLYHLPDVEKMIQHHNTQQKTPQKHPEIIKNLLIPTLINYLNFTQFDVKQQAGKQLGDLTHKLEGNDRGDFVLKHVIEMAHDDVNEENRIVAVQLFSNMSDVFGKQLCEQFIGLEILSLGEDTSPKVRKQAIKHLPIICKLVSKQFFNRLFSFYQSKTKDQSNWALRKTCVDIIVEMSQLCETVDRETALTEIMLTLLRDSNKWVRVSAYKSLGKFIYILKGQKINQKLISEYCQMVNNDVNSIAKDNQIMYSCAYNFPAVLDSIGKGRWQSDLWKVYQKLLKNNDKKIKKTLSQSLHQIAKILGEQLTQKYLFAVVDMFFKDKNDDIKLGTIRNMSGIMGVLSQQKRKSLIGVFEEFQKDQKKWRIRECIGNQLSNILEIYSPETIFEYVVPILFKFCSDSVSIVRQEAAMKVGDFITKFEKEGSKHLIPGLVANISGFGLSPKYTQRQAFLIMCKKLMSHKELFMENFMDIMAELKKDKVVNVKLLLAETVKDHMDQKGPLSSQERLLGLRDELKKDPDEEVRDVFEDE